MQKLPDITVNAAPKSTNLPEPVRQLPVPGLWGYLSQWSTAPGGSVGVHVSAEADHEVELLRLGTCALLDPASSLDDDRAEATVLQRWSRPAAPQTIAPGSYVLCGGPPVDTDGLSAGLWLRLWALPKIDVVQVAYAGIIGDIDYPDCARFGLLLDHVGQIGVYCGDGGPFRYSALHRTAPVLADRLGSWCHVAATVSHEGCVVYVDGAQVARFDGASLPPQPAGSRFRIGAMAEGSAAANFLDGDIAQSFLGSPITASAARSLYDAQGARPVSEILGEALHAEWPLDEEDGVDVADRSGNARHGTIVNHGCWMVGGPAFDAKGCRPDNHDPSRAPHRGHGLRLCSDSLMDARWPVAIEAPIAAEAPSGVYGIRVRLVGQDDAAALTMPLVVSRRTPPTEDCLAIIAATNTWHAYGRRPTNELAVHGLTSSLYSTHRNGRPFFHLGLRLPLPHADPFRYETARAAQTRSTHLVRTERHLEAWLRREGYRFEMVSDLDLHVEPELLERFRAVAVVGHNEYWSDEARDGLERYLSGGGRVLSLSGDTMSVRVSFDRTLSVMECRKTVSHDDARWLTPDMWGESWHSQDGRPGGSFRRNGRPASNTLGLSFKGMIDDGIANAFGPYTVVSPEHFLMRGPHPVEADENGQIGTRSLNGSGGAVGYEFDALPQNTGTGSPLEGVTVLASAIGQENIEWVGPNDHGADLIYWDRPSGGTVVNFGSIAAAGALAVDAPLANLARNALAYFGIGGKGSP